MDICNTEHRMILQQWRYDGDIDLLDNMTFQQGGGGGGTRKTCLLASSFLHLFNM